MKILDWPKKKINNAVTVIQIGDRGVVKTEAEVFSYQLGFGNTGPASRVGYVSKDYERPCVLQIDGGYYVLGYGPTNLEPQEVKETITQDKLLPELIEKQVRFLMGKGWTLYKTIREGKSIRREYLEDKEIESWLSSWKENGGADSIFDYLNKSIREYYYMEGVWTKWRMGTGMFSGDKPVSCLESVSNCKSRFATKFQFDPYDYSESDFGLVAVGGWRFASRNIKVYPKFSYANPFAYQTSISYQKNTSFGEEVYSFNTWFKGIKKWLNGTKLTPEYINSFLENSLSAKYHVIIPEIWLDKKRDLLETYCKLNSERKEQGKELIKVNDIEIGTSFHEGLLTQYVEVELKKFTTYMSGSQNQGKVFTSYAYRTDKESIAWEIKPIPQDFKEYIDALISYDKRADAVILAAKGLDPSISNLSPEGIFSKSGSDAYYNYLIYIMNQTIPETVVCTDINHAIKLNFPRKWADGIRLGFYIDVPAKQEDTPPANRLSTPNSNK